MTWIAYFLLYPVSLISRPQSTSLCAENKGRKLATLACYIYGSWSDPPLIFTGLENIIYHDSEPLTQLWQKFVPFLYDVAGSSGISYGD